jgi:hypothetical protein
MHAPDLTFRVKGLLVTDLGFAQSEQEVEAVT